MHPCAAAWPREEGRVLWWEGASVREAKRRWRKVEVALVCPPPLGSEKVPAEMGGKKEQREEARCSKIWGG